MRKFTIIAALLLITGMAFGQCLQKGNLVGVHHLLLTPNEGYTMEQVTNFYVKEYCPAYEKAFPGIEVYFSMANRGEFVGECGLIFICESMEIRDKYWPSKDEPSVAAEAGYKKMEKVWDKLGKIVLVDSGDHTDFVVF
jgi:hypothetical protein